VTGRRAAVALVGLALAAAASLGGCKKKQEEPAPTGGAPPVIGEVELKRGHDACNAYVAKVCECAKTVEAAQEKCKLAKALPESLEVALQVAAHPETERKDVLQSADALRKTVARCIEQTAKLPELGCP
jgi:hypothetical protein